MSTLARNKVSIRDLNTPVNICARVVTKDDRGGVSYSYPVATWPNVFAKVRSVPVTELSAGGTLISALKHKVTIRYRDGVVPGMQVMNLISNTPMYVQVVNDIDSQHIWLELTCVETEPVA